MRRWATGVALVLGGCVAAAAVPPVQVPVAAPVPRPVPRPVPQPAPVLMLDGAVRQGGVATGLAPAGTVALTLDGVAVPIAADRRFVIGFDRDAPTPVRLEAVLGDGRRVVRDHAVSPGAWRIERVDAPLTAGRTTAEFARLRPVELAEIAAARAMPTAASGWRRPFRWPARGRQSGWFGSQRIYRGVPGGYHSGADVAVPTGTPVLAPADGVVILASDRPFTLEGNLLMIDHGGGITSALLHLSRINVRVGEAVRQGQPVARSGATGRATGPHLHWGLRWREAKLDPLLVVGAGPGSGPAG